MYIDGAYRHPTFLYESLWDLAGFVLLSLLARQPKIKTGDVVAGYFIWYSCGRFVIEYFRTDSLMLGSNIKMAMLISCLGVLLGLALLVVNRRFPAPDIAAMQLSSQKTKTKKKRR